MSKNKDIVLSIGLLVSNRRDTIQKCLDSLAPIREAIPSELIIIDTGCDADLHELLEKYADKIECFTWCNDFAKARNASLALATGEWFLYLDDDEWFSDTKAVIDFFQSGKYKNYGSAAYIQRNYLDFEGSQYTDTWVGRMTKLDEDTTFKSKIHEYISPRKGADADLNSIVEHYGYVYKTEEDKRKHFERNFTLLKEMVEEEPDELRWKLQLVQELRTVDAFEDMVAYGKEYLTLVGDYVGGYESYAKGSFYASVILGCMGLEDYAGAKEWCEKLRGDNRVNKLALTLAEQNLTKALFYLGEYEASIEAAKQYFEYRKYFKFHRDELHLSQKVPFVGEVFDVVKVKEMYSLLICSGLKLQDATYLGEYMHKLAWNEKHLYVFEEITDTLIEAMCTMGYRKAFYRIVKIIRAHSALNEYFYGKVEEWKEKGVDVTPIENIDKWGIRKRTQKQLLEIVDSLIKVNAVIKSLVDMGNKEQLEGILSEAQNVAISLGTAIENGLGLGTVAVGILEQYCEVLWSISQATDDTERQELIAILSELMEREREEITNFPIKTVAVFMPYKASMWDSLESVWLAARDDEMCDDYVVPIPYFDLDGNGQFKKYNYEGPLFPEYVPVTFYEDYNLEAEHPDMIYIHNPYDQFNTVTCVAPDYYCSKLKDYTDNLVYIPYFVLGDIFYDHFCVLPGTIYSDYVIVQSEKARSVYIKKLNEFANKTPSMATKLTNEILEKKVIALGSPKIDKVINAKKEDYELPEEWAKLIEGKTVVLYNTGISGLLAGNEKELQKIIDVFSVFRVRKDVVLWWRPHPLNETTLKAMRPKLYEQYAKVVNLYKKEGFGIFDDTSDLYRALMWTDVYYGDDSSLVYLYGIQGKPIIKQNIMVNSEVDYTGIDFDVSVYEEETLWISARDHNGLYKINTSSGVTEFVELVPNEQEVERKLYSNIIKCDDVLWMVPFRAHYLSGYNVKTGEFEQYRVTDRIKFSTMNESKIYMLSYDYKTFWIFDLKTKEMMSKKVKYDKSVDVEGFPLITEYYNTDLYLKNNKMCFIVLHTNLLVTCDLDTQKAEVRSIGNEKNMYGNLMVQGDKIWLFPVYQFARITCLDGKTIKEIDEADFPKEFQHTYGFAKCKYWNNKIWLFPVRGNMILMIDPKTMQIKTIRQLSECFNIENVHVISDEQIIYTTSISDTQQCIHRMNSFGNEIEKFYIRNPQKHELSKKSYFKRLREEEYISVYSYENYETTEINLVKMLEGYFCESELCNQKKYFRSLFAGADGKAGVHILDSTKGKQYEVKERNN